MSKRRARYERELPRRMYAFFTGYANGTGAPSFQKFARHIGLTLEELSSFRSRSEFDAAWRECNEIRRDYLIDQALSKRFDASFTKFIYALEYPTTENEGDDRLAVTVEVLGDENGA